MVINVGLEGLLAALREAGLRVGVGEVERLRRVFELEPDFFGDTSKRLKSLLRAVVVKTVDDHAVFEQVCDAWLGQEVLAELGSAVKARAPLSESRRTRWHRGGWQWGVAALILLAIVVASVFYRPRGHVDVPPPPPQPLPQEEQPEADSIEMPTPRDVEMPWFDSPEPVWAGWTGLGLAALALASAGGLWGSLRRRRWLPEPAPEPDREGPSRAVLLPAETEIPRLLDAKQQETLVWGIGRFVAEEITRHLDLKATVRATAKAAGLPRLCFHRARYHREVWLWVDEAADDPVVEQLADEVEATLVVHGLSVERAIFRGIPERLVTSDGHVFAPREVDERRDGALVAVLTNGRGLVRQWESDMHRVGIRALLRQLSHWPRLAFVDFGGEAASDLGRLLEKHDLDVVAAESLAAFLGSPASPPPDPRRPAPAADPVWAAACALAPASIDDATAIELGRSLGIPISPWTLGDLRADSRISPGRLRWAAADRARRVNWLRDVEGSAGEGKGSVSRVDQALDFWEEKYEHALSAAEEGTPARQQLAAERWLLGLWRRPNEAARRLYELYRGALRRKIRLHLALLTPSDRRSVDRMALPWPWCDLSAATRVMLLEMGLGGEMPAENLRRPGRLWAGLGVCLGLAVGAVTMAAFEPPAEAPPREVTDPRTGMVFVRISPGSFLMGSPESEEGRWPDEGPVHEVTLSEYWIGKHEVTRGEYKSVNFDTPDPAIDLDGESALPVTRINWHEARAFCEHLGYQLPSEAQWEFAARAGTTSRWSFGNNVAGLGQHAWFAENSDDRVHPVGQLKPNPWGLYDMHGNVWEWCWDRFGDYEAGSQGNPLGPPTGVGRVLRGGSFADPPWFLRSACRFRVEPGYRGGNFGFRCVRVPRRQP